MRNYIIVGENGRTGLARLSKKHLDDSWPAVGDTIDLYSYLVLSIGGRVGIDTTVFAPMWVILLRWAWSIAIQEILLFVLLSLEWGRYLDADGRVSIDYVDDGFAILVFLILYNLISLLSFVFFLI